jgi:hypothetical protein
MPLTQADEKAFSFIANNPKLRANMLKGLKEEGFVEHPAVKEHIDFEERLAVHLKPIQEENAELKKRVDERERSETWTRQRESVRKGPFGFNDDKISKLEERMRSKDAPQFAETDSQGRTAYQQAALYFQHQDSPVATSTFPVLDFAGPSQKAETWRESLTESDKSKNPLHMNRRERRRLGDKLWEEAKNEYMTNLQNR